MERQTTLWFSSPRNRSMIWPSQRTTTGLRTDITCSMSRSQTRSRVDMRAGVDASRNRPPERRDMSAFRCPIDRSGTRSGSKTSAQLLGHLIVGGAALVVVLTGSGKGGSGARLRGDVRRRWPRPSGGTRLLRGTAAQHDGCVLRSLKLCEQRVGGREVGKRAISGL